MLGAVLYHIAVLCLIKDLPCFENMLHKAAFVLRDIQQMRFNIKADAAPKLPQGR